MINIPAPLKLNFQRNPASEDDFKYSSCDVYLRHSKECGEENIYLSHSLVLRFHSKKLEDDFKINKFTTATDGRMIVDISKDINESVLQSLIQYMYTGITQIPLNDPEKANVS